MSSSSSTRCPFTLFIANMNTSVTEGDLIQLFMNCGNVVRIDYQWHTYGPNKGQPTGFAFVEMK